MVNPMTNFTIPKEAVEAYKRKYRENYVDGKILKVDERIARAIAAALPVMFEPCAFEYRNTSRQDGWFPCHPDLYDRRESFGDKYEFRFTAYRLKEPK
jgi:hypothetical protein